jgi:hypothetical protein
MMQKAIAYNVETNEVIAVIEAYSAPQLDAMVNAQNYDYDDVAISYGADHGLSYTDETQYVTASIYRVYDAELDAAGYSPADVRELVKELESKFPTVLIEVVYDTVGGKRWLGEDEDLGLEVDMAKEKILMALEASAA